MRLPLAMVAFAAAVAFAPPAVAKSALLGCDAYAEKLRAESGDLQVEVAHAVIVSRTKNDTDVFDITTKSDVDGTLTCRGQTLLRFEAHVAEPASARAMTSFEKLQAASLRAALGWDAGKAKAMLRSMANDAKEYYAASRERGDVYVAGKTEEHLPGGISLGLIFTDVDRAFLIVNSGD